MALIISSQADASNNLGLPVANNLMGRTAAFRHGF
jgi:hypothetical protein